MTAAERRRAAAAPRLGLPNLLTVGRVLLVPLVVGCFYVEGDAARLAAGALFALAAATDLVDGRLARARGQVSALGRWLDPVADKLLVGATLVMLVGFDRAPLIPAVVILVRELLVSGLREYMAEAGLRLAVTRLAKWKTGVQMAALGLLLVGAAGPAGLPLEAAGRWGLWAAAALTAVTGWGYLRVGLGHMLGRDAGGGPARGAA